MAKLRVGILYGGRSTEHEVSIASATTVLSGMDPSRYVPVLIGVDSDGRWRVAEPELELLPEAVFHSDAPVRCAASLEPGRLAIRRTDDHTPALDTPLDLVFPIIHGRDGEDGSIQGLLQMAEMPYVGTDVKATALCMDKTLAKAVLRNAGLPVVPSRETSVHALLERSDSFIEEVEAHYEYPVFVKPTNTGSSVGIVKARTRAHLRQGIKEARRYDLDVLVEPGLVAREIECAVLGGHEPRASVLGEVRYEADFYDYAAKYASDATELLIPADLPEALAEELRAVALRAFRALKCWGMARVDFFVDAKSGEFWVNELNTHPGFTEVSMYPRLWMESGVALPELIDRLIELGLERHRERAAVEVRYRA